MRCCSASGVDWVTFKACPIASPGTVAEHRCGAGVPAGDVAGEVGGPDRFARLLDDGREQAALRFALGQRGDQALDVVGHVVEGLRRQAHLRRALGRDAHAVLALAETVRAHREHAQRAEVAAEDQPDELQHEEQRHRQDLQLLGELLPEPVVRFDRRHPAGERAVPDTSRRDLDAFLEDRDGREGHEPSRRVELVVDIRGNHLLAVPVRPDELVGLRLLDLTLEELADRLVVADQGLVGDQGREEHQRFRLFAPQPGGMLGCAFRHEQGGLHAAGGNHRAADRGHQARDQSP
jgi:hypothetical protein